MPTHWRLGRSVSASFVAGTVLAVLLADCAGSPTGAGTDAGTEAGTEAEGGTTLDPCGDIGASSFEPAEGVFCSVPGRACSCYDDLRDACKTVLTCDGANWRAHKADCPAPPPTTCPPDVAQARNQPCVPHGAICSFGTDVFCACLMPGEPAGGGSSGICNGPSTPTWFCGYQTAGCPEGIPQLGAPCPVSGVQCGDACVRFLGGPAIDRACLDGTWQLGRASGECL